MLKIQQHIAAAVAALTEKGREGAGLAFGEMKEALKLVRADSSKFPYRVASTLLSSQQQLENAVMTFFSHEKALADLRKNAEEKEVAPVAAAYEEAQKGVIAGCLSMLAHAELATLPFSDDSAAMG